MSATARRVLLHSLSAFAFLLACFCAGLAVAYATKGRWLWAAVDVGCTALDLVWWRLFARDARRADR